MTAPEIEISPALRKLLDIMTSPDVPVAQSVAAARAIIEYEAVPWVFDLTYQFLMGVAEDSNSDVGLQLKALELIRKVEARRVSPGTAKAVDSRVQEALSVRLAKARQRLELFRERNWPAPKGWDEGLAPIGGAVVEVDELGARLEGARLAFSSN
ncbi:hypothetical protein [Mesorhizobium sophorae]|uniref:hypothetical protein n=1 Tax=Mesorhizobium sophorae TaxID=1300294 RepID=UPI001FDA942C|nr:hypothetical protein [Mesorhizobium sophorae]